MNKPINDRKIRFALVGCGRIATNHIGAIEAHSERCELSDVCDIEPARVADAIEKTGARGHPSFERLLADTRADCVVLASPSGLHSAQAIRVAESGRHVMTEKPMATRWQDGLDMVRACDAASAIVVVHCMHTVYAEQQYVLNFLCAYGVALRGCDIH